MGDYSKIEGLVKEKIRESLNKKISGWNDIDPDLPNSSLIERWVTDIMAIGFNNYDLNKASLDIYEMQKPLEGLTIPHVLLENIRGRVSLTLNRFSDEIEAFIRYVELRDKESDDIILFKVQEEQKFVNEGDFFVI